MYAVTLSLALAPRRPRRSTTQARRTIKFVCFQKHGSVQMYARKSTYSLFVTAADELDLSEVMRAMIEDIHRIADKHDACADVLAKYDDGRCDGTHKPDGERCA